MTITLRPSHLVAILLTLSAGWLFGQGSLTPPGAPAPSMKSLDQIESRTPVAGGTTAVTISASGSYYLTGNLTVDSGDAITITAANVTLDLRGFTISTTSATPAGSAVRIGARRVTVGNGNVSGAGTVSGATFNGGGFINGVIWTGSIPQSITVHDIAVTGCSGIGIKATSVERCVLQNIGTTGISGTIVRGCSVDPCGGTAIFGTVVSDCFGNGFTTGINGGSIANSYGASSTDASGSSGISCTAAQNCVGSGYGINGYGLTAVTAVGCTGTSQNATGLKATSATASRGLTANGVGLAALEAAECTGETTGTGLGIVSDGTLTGCFGRNLAGTSPAISGNILIGCTYGGGALSAGYKYNMP